jgi:hypothetical protein
VTTPNPLTVWLEYYVATEEFDRTLPGYWSPHERDCWIPRADARGESNRFAVERYRSAEIRCSELGFDPQAVSRGRDEASGISYPVAKQLISQVTR